MGKVICVTGCGDPPAAYFHEVIVWPRPDPPTISGATFRQRVVSADDAVKFIIRRPWRSVVSPAPARRTRSWRSPDGSARSGRPARTSRSTCSPAARQFPPTPERLLSGSTVSRCACRTSRTDRPRAAISSGTMDYVDIHLSRGAARWLGYYGKVGIAIVEVSRNHRVWGVDPAASVRQQPDVARTLPKVILEVQLGHPSSHLEGMRHLLRHRAAT